MKLPRSMHPLALLMLPTLLLGACDEPASDAADPDEDVAPEDDFEEPPEPPANWNTPLNTSSAPTVLEVYANGAGSGSGTGAAVKLTYVNKAGTYACTISNGVPAGTTRTCTPSKVSDTASSDYDRFYITFTTKTNSDGLRYSTVRVTIDGTSYAVNEFSPDSSVDGEFTCQGCDVWGLCGSCWLDGAGHGKCVSVKLSMTYEFPVVCDGFN